MTTPAPLPPEETRAHSRWAVRVGVYVMLVTSAVFAFFLDGVLWAKARDGSLPVWAPLIPVITFTAFVAIYVVDRWLLIKKQQYPVVRALFQVGIAVAFLSLLWPGQASELKRARQTKPKDPAAALLWHRDAPVRAAACELLGLRMQADSAPRMAELVHDDPSQAVRAACSQALTRLDVVGERPGDAEGATR